ncbi:restriction endonuclease subunit S [Capnocytophaga granulosa]
MNTKQLRQKILDLAIRGELVPQDPTDEPASVLLERIRAEKEQLIKDKKLKRDKKDNEPIDEVPFELPEGWVWCRLGEICEINPKNKLDDELEVAFIPMPFISDGFSNTHTFEVEKWKDIKKGYTHFQNGDIGVAKITPCFENRKSVIFNNLKNGVGAGTTELYILRNNKILSLNKYIFWFVKTQGFIDKGTESFTGAVGQQRISREFIENTLIPLPPLAEQHRIVEKIEQLFALVDTIETHKEQLKSDVKQAKIQVLNYAIAGKLTHQDPNDEPAEELLKRIGKTTTTAPDTPYEKLPKGWAWCRLGEVANISMGQSPKGETVTRNSNGIEFHQGKIYFTDKYINKSPFFTSEPTKTTSNSVLLCVRAPVGEVNLVNREICIGRGLCAIEPLGNISIDFCFFWLILLKDYFNENSTGSTFSSISGEIIRNAFIPLPPLAEQHRIVEKIETFFASFDQIEKMLT